MDDPPPSKHTATVGCDNIREPARDGVRVDGER